MTTVFNVLKWIFGIISAPLSVLIIAYFALKNEEWLILSSDGDVIVTETMGICLIVAWVVIGALYLLFEFLYKRSKRIKQQQN